MTIKFRWRIQSKKNSIIHLNHIFYRVHGKNFISGWDWLELVLFKTEYEKVDFKNKVFFVVLC